MSDTQTCTVIIDGVCGIYVPQVFATNFAAKWGVEEEDIKVLKEGPSHEDYWEVWDAVLDKASYKDEEGKIWSLHQDGDLFSVREDHEWEDNKMKTMKPEVSDGPNCLRRLVLQMADEYDEKADTVESTFKTFGPEARASVAYCMRLVAKRLRTEVEKSQNLSIAIMTIKIEINNSIKDLDSFEPIEGKYEIDGAPSAEISVPDVEDAIAELIGTQAGFPVRVQAFDVHGRDIKSETPRDGTFIAIRK